MPLVQERFFRSSDVVAGGVDIGRGFELDPVNIVPASHLEDPTLPERAAVEIDRVANFREIGRSVDVLSTWPPGIDLGSGTGLGLGLGGGRLEGSDSDDDDDGDTDRESDSDDAGDSDNWRDSDSDEDAIAREGVMVPFESFPFGRPKSSDSD